MENEYRIIKTEEGDSNFYSVEVRRVTGWKPVIFPTCFMLKNSSGMLLEESILKFKTPEEAKLMLEEFFKKPTVFKYKNHKMQKRFYTGSWKITYIDYNWRKKDYGCSRTYNYGTLEQLHKDIDEKYAEPKTSIIEKFFM